MSRKAYLSQNVEEATRISWTNNTGAAIAVGDIGGIKADAGHRVAAMAFESIAAGETGVVFIRARVRVKKDTNVALVQCQTAWWDFSAQKATTHAIANTANDFALGMVVKSESASSEWVEIDLNECAHSKEMGSSSSSSSSSSSLSSSSSSSCSSSSSSSSSSSCSSSSSSSSSS
jgi:hypothetical protein